MKQRASNFELLRILSMLLIIGHHFAVHGGFYFHTPEVTGNMLFLQLLNMGGKIGVNLFVLISGYFLVTAPRLRWGKVLRIWLQIFFYSTLIYGIACLTGLTRFTPAEAVRACLPVSSRQWWFASTYFALYLLSGLLSRVLRRLPKPVFLGLLLAGAVLWCIFPVLTRLSWRVRDLAWFLFLFSAAGYLRLHGREVSARGSLALGAAAFFLTYLWAVVRLYFTAQTAPRYETTYLNMYELPALLTSLMLFRGFAAVKLAPSQPINAIASLSFGVYLIHDSDYLRYSLWQGLAKAASFGSSPWLIPWAITMIVLVYLVCGGLEALRKRLFRETILWKST